MALSCSTCSKHFHTEKALWQHQEATGHEEPAFECATCGKTFGTQKALDQHCEATGHDWEEEEYDSYECEVCGREFYSEEALWQHQKAKGHNAGYDSESEYEIEVPEPPLDSPGQWVLREDFEGRKSFGYFVCDCGRFWTSAHSFKEYRQGCQGCETECFPHFLWENFGERIRKDPDELDDEKPHDSARCEACRRGACNRGFFGY